jgi:hypothetical protein
MSISSVSTNTAPTQQVPSNQNAWQQGRQDFADLASALQSGDLQSAQSAFAKLQSALGNLTTGAAPATTATSAQSGVDSDFNALKSALSSGDVQSAQSAFQKLMQDLKAQRHPHGHGHHHAVSGAAAPTASNASDANSVSSVSGAGGLNVTA